MRSAFLPGSIGLAAFLLFSLEPMIGKVALPWFGGSAEVWTACLLFFQVALFAGYLYARLLAGQNDTAQRRVHTILLLASLAFLPILPGPRWAPSSGDSPLLSIIRMLALTIGVPFVLLSSTTPLLQSWQTRTRADRQSPYGLFALSNFGAFVALVSYPTVIEPGLTLSRQGFGWSWLYVVLVILAVGSTWQSREAAPAARSKSSRRPASPPPRNRVLWLLLSALPSGLLLAVTQHLCRDIAPVPLLWVVPLALYLLSLAMSFGWTRWYYRPAWHVLLLIGVYSMTQPLAEGYLFHNYRVLMWLYSLGFFVCCCVCHAELAALRPQSGDPTIFYLTTAAGGLLGGMLVAIVAPALLETSRHDLPILAGAIVWVVFGVGLRNWRTAPRLRRIAVVIGLALTAGLSWRYVAIASSTGSPALVRLRTFYGSLSVAQSQEMSKASRVRELFSGNISHGKQFVAEDRRGEPLTYYTRGSGIGVTLQELGRTRPLRVGVVGLGIGTIAAYSRAGDVYRFYELDPAVVALAQQQFWYLRDCAGACQVIVGDGRLSLERGPPQRFDVLAIDAFTSDAIPTHLLTKEAFVGYQKQLAPDGVLALHVTNHFVDLASVAAAAAAAIGASARLFANKEDARNGGFSSEWVLITSGPDFFDRPALQAARAVEAIARPWTDDYSSLWRQLR